MERKLGNIFGYSGGNYAGNVYDQNYMCPTLNTMQGGYKQPMIIKDVKSVGNLSDAKTQSRTVYDSDGISPTLCSGMDHGNTMPHIVDATAIRMVRTEEGKRLRKDYELGKITHGFNEHREMEVRKDGVCNTLSTVQKDNYICEKTIIRQVGRNPENPTSRKPGLPTEQRLEPNSQGICNTLTSVQKDNMVMEKYSKYRIRKLTPKECWRLMNFTDEDFEKSAAVNSQTQLYKQAGNSIVVNVLVAILGQMIPGKEDVYKMRCN